MSLNLEVQMETNRTWGSVYPGRARQADGWLQARLRRIRGKGLIARLERDRTWKVEVDGEGGTLILSGRTGTNEIRTTFVPKEALSRTA